MEPEKDARASQSTDQSGVITDRMAQSITRVEELAYELRVKEVMTRDLKALSPDMPMSVALDMFRAARISGAPVVEDGHLIGVISLEDLIRCLTSGSLSSNVESYMSRSLVTVRCTDPVVEAL